MDLFVVLFLLFVGCAQSKEAYYGNKFELVLPKKAYILEFTPEGTSARLVLWSLINMKNNRGARGTLKGNTWEATNTTHLDGGRYAFRTASGIEISSVMLYPREQLIYHDVTKNSILKKRLLVFTHEAVVTFIDDNEAEHLLFKSGVQTEKAFQIFTHRLQIRLDHGELMFTLTDLQSSDVGRFEVHGLGGLAAVIWLSETGVWSDMDLSLTIGIPVCIIVLIFCCCCMRKLCNMKCAVPRPAPNYPQPAVHIHAPLVQGGLTTSLDGADHQPRQQSHSSAKPSRNPPSYNEAMGRDPKPFHPYPSAVPSETSAAATGGGGAHPGPSAPLDTGIQYQPKGWGGGLDDFLTSAPLGVDTDNAPSTFNSDKLNF